MQIRYSTPAMKTWAVNFASAEVPRRSSISPRPTIIVHVTSAASVLRAARLHVGEERQQEPRRPEPDQEARPYIASPPIVGVATGWTLRSPGGQMAPTMRTTMRRTSGVTRNVVPALARKISR